MLHLPGAPPTAAQHDKAIAIHDQHMSDWNHSTLGRGTMNNALFGTCASTRVYGCGTNPMGSLRILQGTPALGTTLRLGLDNPLGTQGFGSLPLLFLATAADPAFPCGLAIQGLGMAGPNQSGELLLSAAPPNPFAILLGVLWVGPGIPAPISLAIPPDQSLVGASLFGQGMLYDPVAAQGVRAALSDAARLHIGR
jgi:hypothetical protein